MKNIVLNILYKYKALDIKILNMKSNYILSNYIIIALGSSSKHVQSIFENTVKELKVNGLYKNTICCGKNTDWIVIDINDIINRETFPDFLSWFMERAQKVSIK